MSIPTAIDRLRAALEAPTIHSRYGHLAGAKADVMEAMKDTLKEIGECHPDQGDLFDGPPAAPGPTHTVGADGLVQTPADEDALAGDAVEAARKQREAALTFDPSTLPSEAALPDPEAAWARV